jgi:hypothetical protein
LESGVCPAFVQKKDKSMSYNSFDVNVLVNGNRCKLYKYNHNTYVEAKYGSEYELEIKNNTYNRILALTSVDGLNVLNGTSASEEDPGYVISGNSPLKIKGFQYNNNEVAAFKFTSKTQSYAKSTGGDVAAQNCGVIGFKIFSERMESPITTVTWATPNPVWTSPVWTASWGGTDHIGSSMDNTGFSGGGIIRSCCVNTSNCSNTQKSDNLNNFNMGTTWGQKKVNKIVETEFKRGYLMFNLDIYYSDRQSLINMGVPLNTANQVSLPKSFPNKFATPPSGWEG